jgi:hypothetical protein
MESPRSYLYLRPFSQRNSTTAARPNTVNPSAISAYNSENKALIVLLVLDLGMESGYTLEGSQIDINRTVIASRCRRIGYTASPNSYCQGLKVESDVWEDKRIICADLCCRVIWRKGIAKDVDVLHLRVQRCKGC